MKFGLRKLIITVAVVAMILAALKYCAPPRIQWQRYDAKKVQHSIDAGENVLVYFRGREENAKHHQCNPETMLSHTSFIKAVQSNQVHCFRAEAWQPSSPAQDEVIRLTGEVPEFTLAAYTQGKQTPILIDILSTRTPAGEQLENLIHGRDQLLP